MRNRYKKCERGIDRKEKRGWEREKGCFEDWKFGEEWEKTERGRGKDSKHILKRERIIWYDMVWYDKMWVVALNSYCLTFSFFLFLIHWDILTPLLSSSLRDWDKVVSKLDNRIDILLIFSLNFNTRKEKQKREKRNSSNRRLYNSFLSFLPFFKSQRKQRFRPKYVFKTGRETWNSHRKKT